MSKFSNRMITSGLNDGQSKAGVVNMSIPLKRQKFKFWLLSVWHFSLNFQPLGSFIMDF